MTDAPRPGRSTTSAGADARDVTGFRVLLAAGALVSFGLGALGLFGAGLFRSAFGADVPADAPGFVGLARLFGSAMVAVGVGYVLAAMHPLRHRGLLVVLFLVPLLGGVALIVAAAQQEFSRGKAAVFAAVQLAFGLLYFRLYPKPVTEAIGITEPGDTAGSSDQTPGAESDVT